MLTFEKVIEVFKDYLTEDTRYEIVMTSHGYTVLEWDSRANGLVRNCAPRRRSCGMCCWIASPGIWNIKRSPQMEKLPWLNRSGSPHSGRRFWRSCNKNQQRPGSGQTLSGLYTAMDTENFINPIKNCCSST